jgi:large subunit ribosomal protein L25
MSENNIIATIRTKTGKGESTKLRAKGLTPAVVYSKGTQTTSITISPKEISKILLSPKRRNSIINLDLQDANNKSVGKKTVITRDLQVEPVKRTLSHIDFMEIDPKLPIAVKVPLTLIGKNQHITAGGKLELVKKFITVSCLPNLIPDNITFDISDISFGATLASAIGLPEGLNLAEDENGVFITIKMPRTTEKEEAQATTATPAAAPTAKAPAKAAAAKS